MLDLTGGAILWDIYFESSLEIGIACTRMEANAIRKNATQVTSKDLHITSGQLINWQCNKMP